MSKMTSGLLTEFFDSFRSELREIEVRDIEFEFPDYELRVGLVIIESGQEVGPRFVQFTACFGLEDMFFEESVIPEILDGGVKFIALRIVVAGVERSRNGIAISRRCL